ncbi:uncharacterized protein LOC129780107 isoform X2 [Toxorhynchites rutilus septentrionalis]|nr:uncharacterized protein LOC129780107 isoform X2 [Toxorhynchites rutilus septentrionalis]XP_055644023.1 uncharacterized protein LOC129780107 isoform X2 [Toxorhynchites rutilus septentrionalis]
MLMFAVICAMVAGASAVPGYASSQYNSAGTSSGVYNQVHDDVYADKYPYAQTGFGGASAGSGVFIPGFAPFQQVPAFPNSVDFNQFFQSLQANFANLAAQVYAADGATVAASAWQTADPQGRRNRQHQHQRHGYPSNTVHNNYPQRNDGHNNNYYPNNLYQQQLAHQNALFNTIRQQQNAFAANAAGAAAGAAGSAEGAHVGGGSADLGGNYAGASASYGPEGFQQTAHIFPTNPESPNVNTRFGGEGIPQGGSGFVGVSSFSSSTNLNGQTHREAVTSVNDNGKVTTYRVRS